jgi:hypothetical protein
MILEIMINSFPFEDGKRMLNEVIEMKRRKEAKSLRIPFNVLVAPTIEPKSSGFSWATWGGSM